MVPHPVLEPWAHLLEPLGHPPLILPTDVVIRYIGYGGQWDPTGAPWAPLGPLGPLGAPVGPLGPHGPLGPQIHCYGSRIIRNPSRKYTFGDLLVSKSAETKLRFGPRDPRGEIRAGILSRIPVLKSQMVPRRPIW